MDKEKIVNEFMQKGLDYLKSAEAFAQTNVPAYLNEILEYQVYKEAMGLLWALIPFFIACFIIYFTFIYKFQDGKTAYQDAPDLFAPATTFSIIFLTTAILLAVNASLSIIQIYVAPRMYLIEYFSGL